MIFEKTKEVFLERPDLPCPRCDEPLSEKIELKADQTALSTGHFYCQSQCGQMPSADFADKITPSERIPAETLRELFSQQ